jgi:molecular chaperone GrpE
MSKKKKTSENNIEILEEAVSDTTEEGVASIEEEIDKETEGLIKEVEKFKALAEENLKHYQYAQATLENLKKRTLQDRNEMRKYGIIPFAKEVLHVVDNLDRALEHLDNVDKESLTQGIEMTISEFNKVLERFGIKQIQAVGKNFDPNIHEAFLKVETKQYSPNAVIEEFEKGYLLDDRLVRPAKVSVSVAPKEEEAVGEAPAEAASEEMEIDINEN